MKGFVLGLLFLCHLGNLLGETSGQGDLEGRFEVKLGILQAEIHLNDTLNIDLKNLTADLMTLPFEYPIELSEENKTVLAQQFEGLAAYNRDRLNERKFPWTGVLFTLALFSVACLIVVKKKKQQPKKESAHHKALKALKELKADPHFQDKMEEDYVKLVNIVRIFIEERYGWNAPTLTTEEFLLHISKTSFFDQDTRDSLDNFMKSADQVKFAQQTPNEQDWLDALETAERFVVKIF